MPKQVNFQDCHYGSDEVSQNITLSNVGFSKISYKVLCPEYVSVNYLQNSGTIMGKGHSLINIKFKPCIYLEDYKNYIQILIKGSHIIYIPLTIMTKKPNVIVLQNSLDFG